MALPLAFHHGRPSIVAQPDGSKLVTARNKLAFRETDIDSKQNISGMDITLLASGKTGCVPTTIGITFKRTGDMAKNQ
jgi:hypothetical protein